MRIGHGYDVHRLVEGRKLILGGVDIPYEKGLLGHSDADVLVHAVADALLGAAALGDIGKLFPDTDERYKGADSLVLLGHVAACVRQNGLRGGKHRRHRAVPAPEAGRAHPGHARKAGRGLRRGRRGGFGKGHH